MRRATVSHLGLLNGCLSLNLYLSALQQSPTQWLQSWQWLMGKLLETPEIVPKLIIDPVNEPNVRTLPTHRSTL